MADKLGLGPEVRELKLGPTFSNGKCATAFHTIKYDFKPASVDITKMATVDVGTNNTMTVTVPHLDGAGTPYTVFKGSQKPYSKECVLIIDKITGEVTLERLSSNIQVKKTRCENKSQLAISSFHSTVRPVTPIDPRISPTNGRTVSKTKVTSGKKREHSHQSRTKNSPSRPSYHGKSPPSFTSVSSSISSSTMPSFTQSRLGSLPMLDESDDFSLSVPVPSSIATSSLMSQSKTHVTAPPRTISPSVKEKPIITSVNILKNDDVGVLSDSSTSDSSSDSSDSESDKSSHQTKVNGLTSTNDTKVFPPASPVNSFIVNDLQLSEESD